jgi:hypothetical protein
MMVYARIRNRLRTGIGVMPGRNGNNNSCHWFRYGVMESMETPYVFSSQ